MTLRWRIRQLMAQKEEQIGEKVTYQKIYDSTGISPNTLSALATGQAKQVGISTIERLLNYFNCKPNDLIVMGED